MGVLHGKRIFVVEDDISNMAIFSVILRQSGALVIQDHWNSGTLTMLARHLPVDIILMDLMLRFGVSGYEIFDQLRELPEFASIPVLAVSASDPEVEMPRLRAKGFAGFVSKPISFQEFPLQVAAAIEGEKVWSLV